MIQYKNCQSDDELNKHENGTDRSIRYKKRMVELVHETMAKKAKLHHDKGTESENDSDDETVSDDGNNINSEIINNNNDAIVASSNNNENDQLQSSTDVTNNTEQSEDQV
jgi:uncharacterized Fe-S cluster-containing protein